MNDIAVEFTGGKRVEARVGDFVIATDQPASAGGQGSAIAPFDLFLASLATCAGYYVLAFCQARGLSMDGLTLSQHAEVDDKTHLPTRIVLELGLPASFPARYRDAIVRAAEGCKVKKTIAAAPSIDVVLAAEPALQAAS